MSALAEVDEEFDQTQFNLEVWEDVLADPFLASLPHQIETDKFGNIIMSPPPGTSHGGFQGELGFLLRSNLPEGRVLGETGVSTSDGVRAIDAGWISMTRHREANQKSLYTTAPEICIEIISPKNTKREIDHKIDLYFEASAEEVWVIQRSGEIIFLVGSPSEIKSDSTLCPNFPSKVILPT